MTHAPCWRHECAQPSCVEQKRRYKKRWRYENDSTGARRTTPAGPIIEHIERCRSVGMDDSQIARLADIPPSTVNRIRVRRPARVRNKTATAVLRVTPDRWAGADPGTLVPRIGARRRLQALMCHGHNITQLESERGIQYSVMVTRYSPSDRMTLANHRLIVELYDELCMTFGDSVRSRNDAVRRGYAPPLAWDDDTIDDPAALPDLGVKSRGVASRLPDDDRLVAEVNRSGVRVVADLYGVDRTTVHKRLRKAGYRASHTGDTQQDPIYRKAAA